MFALWLHSRINIKISLEYQLFSFCLEFIFKALSQMKKCISVLLSVLRTDQSEAVIPLLCCLNWSVDPRDTAEVLFLSLD